MLNEIILYDITANQSKINPSDVYTLYFIDENLKKYEMSVDSSYRNYKNWIAVLNSDNPYGIYSNIRLSTRKTNKKVTVLDADSKPYKVQSLTIDQIFNWVEKRKEEIAEESNNSLFKFL